MRDPATGAVLTEAVPDASADDARAAVQRAAGPGTRDWAPLPAKVCDTLAALLSWWPGIPMLTVEYGGPAVWAQEKARLLMALHKAIDDNKEDLARLITLENGKPLAEARGEVIYGNSYLAWFAEEAKRVNGDILPPRANNERVMVR